MWIVNWHNVLIVENKCTEASTPKIVLRCQDGEKRTLNGSLPRAGVDATDPVAIIRHERSFSDRLIRQVHEIPGQIPSFKRDIHLDTEYYMFHCGEMFVVLLYAF